MTGLIFSLASTYLFRTRHFAWFAIQTICLQTPADLHCNCSCPCRNEVRLDMAETHADNAETIVATSTAPCLMSPTISEISVASPPNPKMLAATKRCEDIPCHPKHDECASELAVTSSSSSSGVAACASIMHGQQQVQKFADSIFQVNNHRAPEGDHVCEVVRKDEVYLNSILTPFSETTPIRRSSSEGSWTQTLIGSSFQDSVCEKHPQESLKYFCLDCANNLHRKSALCKRCVEEDHTQDFCNGRIIQIYRYMLNDIVRVSAIQQLINVDGIQQYCANNHLAIHLRPRGPVHEPPKTHNIPCAGRCGRFMKEGWHFCSLACKMISDASRTGDDSMFSTQIHLGHSTSFDEVINAMSGSMAYCSAGKAPSANLSCEVAQRAKSMPKLGRKTSQTCHKSTYSYQQMRYHPMDWYHRALRKGLQGAARRKLRSPERSFF